MERVSRKIMCTLAWSGNLHGTPWLDLHQDLTQLCCGIRQDIGKCYFHLTAIKILLGLCKFEHGFWTYTLRKFWRYNKASISDAQFRQCLDSDSRFTLKAWFRFRLIPIPIPVKSGIIPESIPILESESCITGKHSQGLIRGFPYQGLSCCIVRILWECSLRSPNRFLSSI